jgi:hypothetical protein
VPAVWDDKVIGYLLLFSATAHVLVQYLGFPQEMLRPDCLMAALLFTKDIDGHHHKRHFPRFDPVNYTKRPKPIHPEDPEKETAYQLGVRIIRLPLDVQKYADTHTSAVWFERMPGDVKDNDTKHLENVLMKSTLVVPTSASAQTVFVHIAALKNIHNLPHLAQRRLRPDIRFCLYGTDPALPRCRWGFREIYLLGKPSTTSMACISLTLTNRRCCDLHTGRARPRRMERPEDHPTDSCPPSVGMLPHASSPRHGAAAE